MLQLNNETLVWKTPGVFIRIFASLTLHTSVSLLKMFSWNGSAIPTRYPLTNTQVFLGGFLFFFFIFYPVPCTRMSLSFFRF